MNPIPFIPDSAPFTAEQRAWLNGFLAGLYSQAPPATPPPAADRKAAEPLRILFGSQSGTAEGLAKRIAREAAQRGFAPQVMALNDCPQADLAAGAKAVIVSSTWGDGDPPDNATEFWNWLQGENAPRLDRLQFAVLGLGDRNYSEFCGAAKKFDARLEALGATRLIPRGECDVDYEAPARSWIDSLWDRLGPATAAGPGSPPEVSSGANHPQPNGSNGLAQGPGRTGEAPAPVFNKSNPFAAQLLKNVLLNKPGSAKEVRHYELDLDGSGLAYEAGDALGVLPANCPELVDELLVLLRCTGREAAQVENAEMDLRKALTLALDITRPSPELLAAAGKAVPELNALLAPERAAELKQWLWGRDVIDVLRLLPAPLPVSELLPLLRKLAPRLYSISSSAKAHPKRVHLTVSALRYESFGRRRKGVASIFLADRAGQAEPVRIFVQPSPGFKPPRDGDTPMIMVGPGTGIAPFRAFLQEREAAGASGKNWLFFGDQTRAADFLYEEELAAWAKNGLLARLDLAFSRDQAAKCYVQHRLMENAPEVWRWLEAGAHFYVCGDASRMARDVDAALHKIIETAGAKSPDAAKAYVSKLKLDRRYQRDVY